MENIFGSFIKSLYQVVGNSVSHPFEYFYEEDIRAYLYSEFLHRYDGKVQLPLEKEAGGSAIFVSPFRIEYPQSTKPGRIDFQL